MSNDLLKWYTETAANPQNRPLLPPRACHDCGRKTRNYRCERCLIRWRRKHGVFALDGEDF